MIEIRRIEKERSCDANIPNQPFFVWGRMIPALSEGTWSYRIERMESPTEMCFPDVPYDLATDDGVFFGAYDADACVGVAVLRRQMFRYLYLDDLKVHAAYRGQGIGKRLIDACMEEARRTGMQGVWTIAQDNNVSACLFYLGHGFAIGGFDNRQYRGTPQEEKADLYFYRDCEGTHDGCDGE